MLTPSQPHIRNPMNIGMTGCVIGIDGGQLGKGRCSIKNSQIFLIWNQMKLC
jgi:hypothetical protein